MKHVSLKELEAETKHLAFFNYTGSDSKFHYFATNEGKRYQLDRSAWENPVAWPRDAGMQLFMTIKDGKLTVPDGKKMSGLSPSELAPPD